MRDGRDSTLYSFFFSGCRPRFSPLAASPLNAHARVHSSYRETARSLERMYQSPSPAPTGSKKSIHGNIHFLSLLISAACVTLNFINLLGFPFKLHSSLKHEVYLVTGSGFKLRFYIDRPELHSHVIFYAEDPAGKRNVLLNGQPSITERVVSDCPHFVEVLVTAQQG